MSGDKVDVVAKRRVRETLFVLCAGPAGALTRGSDFYIIKRGGFY